MSNGKVRIVHLIAGLVKKKFLIVRKKMSQNNLKPYKTYIIFILPIFISYLSAISLQYFDNISIEKAIFSGANG